MCTSLSQGVSKRSNGRTPAIEVSSRAADLTSRVYQKDYWFTVCPHTATVEMRFLDRSQPVIIGSVREGRWIPNTRSTATRDQLERVASWLSSPRVNHRLHGLYDGRSPDREYTKPSPKARVNVPEPAPRTFSAKSAYQQRAARRAAKRGANV